MKPITLLIIVLLLCLHAVTVEEAHNWKLAAQNWEVHQNVINPPGLVCIPADGAKPEERRWSACFRIHIYGNDATVVH